MEDLNTVKRNIADNLIFYRKQKGLTQLDIAEKFNYSDKYSACVGLLDADISMKVYKNGYYLDNNCAWVNKENYDFTYTDLGPNVSDAPSWVYTNLNTHIGMAKYLTDPNNMNTAVPKWGTTIKIVPNWLCQIQYYNSDTLIGRTEK